MGRRACAAQRRNRTRQPARPSTNVHWGAGETYMPCRLRSRYTIGLLPGQRRRACLGRATLRKRPAISFALPLRRRAGGSSESGSGPRPRSRTLETRRVSGCFGHAQSIVPAVRINSARTPEVNSERVVGFRKPGFIGDPPGYPSGRLRWCTIDCLLTPTFRDEASVSYCATSACCALVGQSAAGPGTRAPASCRLSVKCPCGPVMLSKTETR